MNYKIGIYAEEYLTLLELNERIDRELPLAEVLIFSKADTKDVVFSEPDYIVTDLSRLKEVEILILLSPVELNKHISDFDGTVIDYTKYPFTSESEVITINNPIEKIFNDLYLDKEKSHGIISLPTCVFGRDGVEDLMKQTKDIFSFESSNSIVFNERIAFNVHINPCNLEKSTVNKVIDNLINEGLNINIRILPISTVFIIDILSKEEIILKSEEGYIVPEGFFMASDLADQEDIFVLKSKNMYTFIGDYTKIVVSEIFKKLKEVIG